LSDEELAPYGGRADIEGFMSKAALATCDFYLAHTSKDGIPYWDTGAPNLYKLGDYTQFDADPFNDIEPVDSSAAAIACQGLLRLGRYLGDEGRKYFDFGLKVLNTLLSEPYLSNDPSHHGLILHSNYHLPNGWDYIPPGRKIACGESCMWGDYHMREAALYVQRLAKNEPYLKFYLPK
jgi:unsaturated chondroitin disaccharide hydrolase